MQASFGTHDRARAHCKATKLVGRNWLQQVNAFLSNGGNAEQKAAQWKVDQQSTSFDREKEFPKLNQTMKTPVILSLAVGIVEWN